MNQTKSINDLRQETISVEPEFKGSETLIKVVKLHPTQWDPLAVAKSLISIPREIEWRYEHGTREELIAHREWIEELANKITYKQHHLDPSVAFFDGGTHWLASELDNMAISDRCNAQCELFVYYGTEQDAAAYAVTEGYAWYKNAA